MERKEIAMIRNLVLESDGKYIQLIEYTEIRWTRVLFHHKHLTVLGAGIKEQIVNKFLRLFSKDSFPPPRDYVDGIKYGGFIALAENHCMGYAAKVGNDIVLLFYDEHDKKIESMKILGEKCEEWEGLLKSF